MRLRSALPISMLSLLFACAPTEDTSSLVLSLDLAVSQAALEIDSDAPFRDSLGLFDLPLITVYVMLEATADDMESVTAEWPVSSTDLADYDGTAVVELEVPPGDARSLDGLVLSLDGGRARAYMPAAPLLVNLTAGTVEVVVLILVETDYGTISGTAPEGAMVEIVDLITHVILARAAPDADGLFEVEGMPIERPLYPVWDFGDENRTPAPELATHIPGAGGGATFPHPR